MSNKAAGPQDGPGHDVQGSFDELRTTPAGLGKGAIMPYYELYYHLVWATKMREPLITPELLPELHRYLRGKGIELGGIVHAVGGIEEHVHIAASIPPRIAVAMFVAQLKGASSHWVTHVSPFRLPFAWQEGYGVFTFSKRALPQVIDYILHQADRHKTGQVIAEMERDEGGD